MFSFYTIIPDFVFFQPKSKKARAASKTKKEVSPDLEATPPKSKAKPSKGKKKQGKQVETSEYEYEGTLFPAPFVLADYGLSVKSDRTSLQAANNVELKAAANKEDDLLEEKPPVKTAKHRSARKATAKEAKEAKESAAGAKAASGWATTFTLNGVQYVLQDAAGHPVSFVFPHSLIASPYFSSDRRE